MKAGLLAGRAGAAFDPAAIAKRWYDFSDLSTLTLSGSAITDVADKGLDPDDLTQATAGSRPASGTETLNGLDVATFAGDFLGGNGDWTFAHDGTSYLVCMVAKAGTGANPGTWYGLMGNSKGSSANRGFSFYYEDTAATFNDNLRVQVAPGAASAFNVNGGTGGAGNNAMTANAWHLLTFVMDPDNGTAGNRALVYVDGSGPIWTNAATAAVSASAPSFSGVNIGDLGGTGVKPLVGAIAEVIVTLDHNDRTDIETYLTAKWGL